MSSLNTPPLRILLAALGGEGGGVLMNWIVTAAREAGLTAQATSVPGVAQRTGSTSYYIEIAQVNSEPVLSLVPMPGRVDVVVSSELVETARVMAAGFVSPNLTTLISSTARSYTVAEKIQMGDGRYSEDNVRRAAEALARDSYLLDLGQIATDNATFVSATMFGALAGSGVLPWDVAVSRAVLGTGRSAEASRAGFDAAADAVRELSQAPEPVAPPPAVDLPADIATVIRHGVDRCTDYQDAAYGALFQTRADRLIAAANLAEPSAAHAVKEACRRLALWMSYEDVARVADLKTRPERFARIRAEAQMQPGQVLTVTEYLKPRAEEIADILPAGLGTRIMARVAAGKGLPFLGRGVHVRSNGVAGYWMLRLMAGLRRIRRRSYRYAEEQAAIEGWLQAMDSALPAAPEFAEALAELPRVLKGYSDTLVRGKRAYSMIMEQIVHPALQGGAMSDAAPDLRRAIAAALADDSHSQLDAAISQEPAIPNLRSA